ncbi:phage tail protein [Aeromonas hydrophila]
MSIKLDLDKALNNLSMLPEKLIPKASAQAVNRISTRASARAIRLTAKDERVRVPAKQLRPRVKIFKATEGNPSAVIRVRRRPIPMIRLGPVQQRLTRRGGRYQAGDMQVGRTAFLVGLSLMALKDSVNTGAVVGMPAPNSGAGRSCAGWERGGMPWK